MNCEKSCESPGNSSSTPCAPNNDLTTTTTTAIKEACGTRSVSNHEDGHFEHNKTNEKSFLWSNSNYNNKSMVVDQNMDPKNHLSATSPESTKPNPLPPNANHSDSNQVNDNFMNQSMCTREEKAMQDCNSVNDLIDSITGSKNQSAFVSDQWHEFLVNLSKSKNLCKAEIEFYEEYCDFMRSNQIFIYGLLESEFEVFEIYTIILDMRLEENLNIKIALNLNHWYHILSRLSRIYSNSNIIKLRMFYNAYLNKYMDFNGLAQIDTAKYDNQSQSDVLIASPPILADTMYSKSTTAPSSLLTPRLEEMLSCFNQESLKQIEKNAIRALILPCHLHRFLSPSHSDFLQSTDIFCRILAGNSKNSKIMEAIDMNRILPVLMNRFYILLYMFYTTFYGGVRLSSDAPVCNECKQPVAIPNLPKDSELLTRWFSSFCIDCLRKNYDLYAMPGAKTDYLAQLCFTISSLIRNLSFYVAQINILSESKMLLLLFVHILPIKQLIVPPDNSYWQRKHYNSTMMMQRLDVKLISKIQDDCYVILANIAIDLEIHALPSEYSTSLLDHFLHCLTLDRNITQNLIKIYLSIKVLSMLASNSLQSARFILRFASKTQLHNILYHLNNLVVQNDTLPIQELCICFLERLFASDSGFISNFILGSSLLALSSDSNEAKDLTDLIHNILQMAIQMNKKVITLSSGLNSTSHANSANLIRNANRNQQIPQIQNHDVNRNIPQEPNNATSNQRKAAAASAREAQMMSIQPLPSWSILEKCLSICLLFAEHCSAKILHKDQANDQLSTVAKNFLHRISEKTFYFSLTSCILPTSISSLVFQLLKRSADCLHHSDTAGEKTGELFRIRADKNSASG